LLSFEGIRPFSQAASAEASQAAVAGVGGGDVGNPCGAQGLTQTVPAVGPLVPGHECLQVSGCAPVSGGVVVIESWATDEVGGGGEAHMMIMRLSAEDVK